MSDPIRNVTLSFPCREDWDKFEVVPGGRLCGSCKYIVRDFRDCSAAQLKEAMKSGQRVCGRFNPEQLSPAFLKAAAVAMAVIPMAVGTGCEEPITAPTYNSQALPVPATGIMVLPDSVMIGDVKYIEGDIELPGLIVEVHPEDSVGVERH
jgi:hypothetical protein